MRLALRLATRGDGRTFPNPSVGAVIFRGDRILGRGFSRPAGGPHAEVVAIAAARRKHGEAALRGASIAVTLEPCSFVGRTGACTDAIHEAGIERVVGGCRDPHPKVRGHGYRILRGRGIAVTPPVLEAACRRQHRGFLSVWERGRPHVTLKLATTLDGRIALANGESRWITGPTARAVVHKLRDASDAVLVGSGTVLADDPELSVRRKEQIVRVPIRVLLDGRLRVPTTARIYDSALDPKGAAETWVLCREGARGLRRVRGAASRVFEVAPGESGYIDLAHALRRLADEGLTTVFVEGGGELAAALLRADLVDEVHWFLAPKLIGGDGRAALGSLELARLVDAVSIEPIRVVRRGEDLHVHGDVVRSQSTQRKRGSRK